MVQESEQTEGEADALYEFNDDMSDNSELLVQETKSEVFMHAWQKRLPGYVCVLQHIVEDYGYDKKGWFVLVNYETRLALIAKFDEQSYFSSQSGIEVDKFIWEGSLYTLLDMASLHRDVTIPERPLQPGDHNFQHWCSLYDGIVAWAQLGEVDWSGTSRWGPWDKTRCWRRKTPFAENMTKIFQQQTRAATLIQAAWRGWKWRLSVLQNPHTIIGHAKLMNAARKATTELL